MIDIDSKEEEIKPLIIGFEGNSGVGKTSIIQEIVRNPLIQSLSINEYFDPIIIQDSIPPQFPPDNMENLKSSHSLWPILEDRRFNQSLNSKEKQIILVDRTILSLLAFEYAKESRINSNIFSDMKGLLRELLNIRNLLIPDVFILIKSSPEDIKNRQFLRDGRIMPFLGETETLVAIQSFFEWVIKSSLPPERYLIIEDNKAFEETTDKVEEFINKSYYIKREHQGTKDLLLNFLKEYL